MIEQTSGRGGEVLDAGEQLLGLGLDRHAAVDDRRPKGLVAAVAAGHLVDLDGQLASRGEDERADRMAGWREARVGLGGEALEDRQDEGRRLARAGLGGGEDVATGEDDRDGLLLDGGGFRIALVRDGAKEVGR